MNMIEEMTYSFYFIMKKEGEREFKEDDHYYLEGCDGEYEFKFNRTRKHIAELLKRIFYFHFTCSRKSIILCFKSA